MKIKNIPFVLALLPLLIICVSAALPKSGQPTILQVTRSSASAANNFPPLTREVKDANAVQQLYGAIHALPKARTGIRYCPIDVGLIYHIYFSNGTTLLEQMDMDTGGCQGVRLSKQDVRQPTEAFLSLFAQTIGVPRSTLAPIPY
ncbi:MAG TPA: hypothetical protein VJO32_13660 [Ktedonobacteraceae bacterium]|nr:hypothetical protein [Ktedonobacteraceae bacterium]